MHSTLYAIMIHRLKFSVVPRLWWVGQILLDCVIQNKRLHLISVTPQYVILALKSLSYVHICIKQSTYLFNIKFLKIKKRNLMCQKRRSCHFCINITKLKCIRNWTQLKQDYNCPLRYTFYPWIMTRFTKSSYKQKEFMKKASI